VRLQAAHYLIRTTRLGGNPRRYTDVAGAMGENIAGLTDLAAAGFDSLAPASPAGQEKFLAHSRGDHTVLFVRHIFAYKRPLRKSWLIGAEWFRLVNGVTGFELPALD